MLKGTVVSLTSRMYEIEIGLSEAMEKAKQIEVKVKVKAKGRVYQKFLADTLSKVVAERRLDYWLQLAEATGAQIPSSTEDSDSEKDEEMDVEAREEEEEEGGEGKKDGEDTAAPEKRVEEEVSAAVEVEPISVVHPSAEAATVYQDVETEFALDDLAI